jgi:hypothetical protein
MQSATKAARASCCRGYDSGAMTIVTWQTQTALDHAFVVTCSHEQSLQTPCMHDLCSTTQGAPGKRLECLLALRTKVTDAHESDVTQCRRQGPHNPSCHPALRLQSRRHNSRRLRRRRQRVHPCSVAPLKCHPSKQQSHAHAGDAKPLLRSAIAFHPPVGCQAIAQRQELHALPASMHPTSEQSTIHPACALQPPAHPLMPQLHQENGSMVCQHMSHLGFITPRIMHQCRTDNAML